MSCVPPSPEAAAGKVTREDGDCGDEAGALPAPEVRAGQRGDRPAPPGRRDTRSAAAPRPSRRAPPPPPPPAPGCAETAGSHREGNLGGCRPAPCGADTSGGRRGWRRGWERVRPRGRYLTPPAAALCAPCGFKALSSRSPKCVLQDNKALRGK